MPNIPDNAKQYGLKPNEIRVINNYNALANQMMASFVSFIAIERLAYTPSENTQFSVEGDKIFIWENEPEAPAVITDTPTGDALKKGDK